MTCLQALSVLIPVVIDVLYVIVVVKNIQDPVDLLHSSLVRDLDIVLGAPAVRTMP